LREVFGKPEVGVLPRLVQSRFGFHVVEVLAREPGHTPEFEQCEGAVRMLLMQQSFATALRQYLQQLAARATIQHLELDASASPLVQ
jgi:peptidyl-prolyl cis-trans isomerase C